MTKFLSIHSLALLFLGALCLGELSCSRREYSEKEMLESYSSFATVNGTWEFSRRLFGHIAGARKMKLKNEGENPVGLKIIGLEGKQVIEDGLKPGTSVTLFLDSPETIELTHEGEGQAAVFFEFEGSMVFLAEMKVEEDPEESGS